MSYSKFTSVELLYAVTEETRDEVIAELIKRGTPEDEARRTVDETLEADKPSGSERPSTDYDNWE